MNIWDDNIHGLFLFQNKTVVHMAILLPMFLFGEKLFMKQTLQKVR